MTKQAILLVDDDEDYVHIVERAVQRENLAVTVQVARNGSEALAMLGIGNGRTVDTDSLAAVFLDVNMPGIDGFEVLRRVRSDARLMHLPVVVVSSSSRPRDVARCYDLGANSYLVKQYDPAGPGRYVATAMRYWLELNRPPNPGMVG